MSSQNIESHQYNAAHKKQQGGNSASSLLLSSANLAWSQPSGCILVAPKPEPEPSSSNMSDATKSNVSTPTNELINEVGSNNSEFNQLSSDLKDLTITELTTSSQVIDTVTSTTLTTTSSPPPPPTSSSSLVQQQSPSVGTEAEATFAANYKEVEYHWFYQKDPEQKDLWQPFSVYDSYNLEYAFQNGWHNAIIATNGTRFDVSLGERTRKPVYWQGATTKVQRCSWFFKRDSDYRFVPYSEDVACILEATYRECYINNAWRRRVDLSSKEFIYFYAHDSVYHYISEVSNDEGWGAMMETNYRPNYAYRGMWGTGAQPERDERSRPDHVVFMVHGIGDFCDISFRKLVQVVDDFRDLCNDLLVSHYSHQSEIGRVEVLPISWHSILHTSQLDTHLSLITLPSIPRMRSFTNDTILDALFYTSPAHAQVILHAVASELNRLYTLFLHRNPHFIGSVALGGHSLGSLILFDLLSHQSSTPDHPNLVTYAQEQLYFRPASFFAFGSPIPVFLTVRGITSLSLDFCLPTCRAFYNIFHPFDPIAYRVEPLINTEFSKLKPVLIPHHKGRKRFHLEIRDSITRMGTDLKQKVLSSIRGTLDSIYGFMKAHQRADAEELNVTSENDQQQSAQDDGDQLQSSNQTSEQPNDTTLFGSMSDTDLATSSTATVDNTDVTDVEQAILKEANFGNLNSGRRIDYVLQERPIEIVNEYLFAIASHGCYWLSEDTALLVLRELYGQSKFNQQDVGDGSQQQPQEVTNTVPTVATETSSVNTTTPTTFFDPFVIQQQFPLSGPSYDSTPVVTATSATVNTTIVATATTQTYFQLTQDSSNVGQHDQ